MLHSCYLATRRLRLELGRSQIQGQPRLHSEASIFIYFYFFIFVHKTALFAGEQKLNQNSQIPCHHPTPWTPPSHLLLCWRGRISSRNCRARGSRNSHSLTSRHMGKFPNTLANDILIVLLIQLPDDLVEPVITSLDAHTVQYLLNVFGARRGVAPKVSKQARGSLSRTGLGGLRQQKVRPTIQTKKKSMNRQDT